MHQESREDTNRFKNSLVNSIDGLSNEIVSNQRQISEKEQISRNVTFELLITSITNGTELASSTIRSSNQKIQQAIETSSKKHIATFNTYITTLYNVIDDFSQTLTKHLSELTSKVIKSSDNQFTERKNYTRQHFESLSNAISQSSKNHSSAVHNFVTDFSQRLVKSLLDLSEETIKSNEDISTRQEMNYEKLLTSIDSSISQSSTNHSRVLQNSVTDFGQRLVKSILDVSDETIKSNEEISNREEMNYKQLITSIDKSISQSSKNHSISVHNSVTDFSQRLFKSIFDFSKKIIESNNKISTRAAMNYKQLQTSIGKSISQSSTNHGRVLHNSVTDFHQELVKSIRDLSRETIKSSKEISMREEMSYKQLLIMLYTKLGTIASEIQNMTLTNEKEMANSSMRIEKAIDRHRDVAVSLSDIQSTFFDTSVSSVLEALENSTDKLVSSTDGISSYINKTSSKTDMVNRENFGALIDKFVTFALGMEDGLKHMDISTSNGLNTISSSIQTSLKDVVQQVMSDGKDLRDLISTDEGNQLKMISDSLSSTKDSVALLSSGIPEKFAEFINDYKTPFKGNAKIHNQ